MTRATNTLLVLIFSSAVFGENPSYCYSLQNATRQNLKTCLKFNSLPTQSDFNDPKIDAFRNILGKEENAGNFLP